MIAKEVIDYISLHPRANRDEIKLAVLYGEDHLLKDLKTRRPETYFNGILDALIDMKIVDVDGPTERMKADKYPAQYFYLSGNIAYIYGVAFGTTSQVIKLKCSKCDTENLVNPLTHPGREKKCRNCHETLFPSRLLPKLVKEDMTSGSVEKHEETTPNVEDKKE